MDKNQLDTVTYNLGQFSENSQTKTSMNLRAFHRLVEAVEDAKEMVDPPAVNVTLSLRISNLQDASALLACIRLIEKNHASGGTLVTAAVAPTQFRVALPDTSRLGTMGLTNR